MNGEKNPVVEIRKTVRGASPQLPYEEIARGILGRRYELSLVICGDPLAKRVNRAYRKKPHAANVLSFSLDAREGEMFLNARAAAREAKRFGVPLRARLALLFIHGCLHLKGLRHGPKMEREEARIMRRFT